MWISQPTYLINLKKKLYIYYNVKCVELEEKKKEMMSLGLNMCLKQRLQFPFVLKECLKNVSLSDLAKRFPLELGHLHKALVSPISIHNLNAHPLLQLDK